MELKELLLEIKKYFLVVIVLVILGVISGAYSTRYFSSGYHHSQTFFLTDKGVPSQSAENIKSESFLTQEKARNFTDTAVAILDSPDFKNSTVKAGDSLLVRKLAPQIISLTYISPNQDSDNSQLTEIVSQFNKAVEFLTESPNASQLKAVGIVLPPSYSSLSASVLAAAGAVFGLIFALFVISLKNYLKI